MGTWTYHSSGAVVIAASGANIDLSGSAPAGVTTGDLLLLFTGQRGTTASVSITAGWTQLVSSGYGSSGTAEVYGRIADGTAADSPSTVDWSGTATSIAWLERWSGGGYTDLATIVPASHSANISGTSNMLQLPAVASVTEPNCLVVGFSIKNNTATDATTISHSVLTVRTQYVSGDASRAHAASGTLQQTTATDYDGTDFTIDGTSESLASRGVVVYLKTADATVKKLKLLAHPSAIGAGSVEGVVLNAARDTVIGEFTGQTFIDGSGESPQVNPGYAVLKIAATDISPDGGTLTTSDTPLVIAYNATYTTPLVACTVIEE